VSFKHLRHSIYTRTQITMYNCTWRVPLVFTSPCQFPFPPSLYPLLLTWNPPSCDRNRPPRSQVACKLTSLVPPFTQPSPLQIPRTPTAQRLTKTTSGIIRLLLSGTLSSEIKVSSSQISVFSSDYDVSSSSGGQSYSYSVKKLHN
jgi:hypothetical protein